MEIIKERTIAFIGNRQLTLLTDMSGLELRISVFNKLYNILEYEYLVNGFSAYLSGMEIGWDMFCGEVVLKLKEKYPDVRLVAAIPFMGQELLYSNQDKQRFKNIYERADHIEFITNDGYDRDAYHKRNDWMITKSSKIIAYDSGLKIYSGTSSTIRKAVQQKVEVLNLFDIL